VISLFEKDIHENSGFLLMFAKVKGKSHACPANGFRQARAESIFFQLSTVLDWNRIPPE
jgi:hypothetical protein